MTRVPTLSPLSSTPYIRKSINVKYVNIIQALIVVILIVCVAVDDAKTHVNRQYYVQNERLLLTSAEMKATTIMILVNDSHKSGAFIAKNSETPTTWNAEVRKTQTIQKNNSTIESTRAEVEEPAGPIKTSPNTATLTPVTATSIPVLASSVTTTLTPVTATSIPLLSRSVTTTLTPVTATSIPVLASSVTTTLTPVTATSIPVLASSVTTALTPVTATSIPVLSSSVTTTLTPVTATSIPVLSSSVTTTLTPVTATPIPVLSSSVTTTLTPVTATSIPVLSTRLTNATKTISNASIQATASFPPTNLEVTTQPYTGTTNASAPFTTPMTSCGTNTSGLVTTTVSTIETTTDACHDRPGIDCETYYRLLDICRKPQQARKICQKYCGLCGIVDGHWSHWSQWKACDVTCAVGIRTRSRECNKPAPVHGGLDCVGNKTEVKPCQLEPCPVHGGWGGWRKWQTCTRSCGLGVQTRVRSCDSQRPDHFGRHCFGEASEIQLCNRQSCPGADGVWTVWSAWSHPCSVTCGGGLRRRIRTCTNPAPSGSGRSCGGDSTQYQTCNGQPCPVAGFWSPWSQWSPWRCQGAATELRSSTRICVGPLYGGDGCQGKGSRQETRNVAICIPDMT